MFKDFKEFAMKGNVMDLAIGVVIGGAFGKIITSLVEDVIMPLVGLMLGKVDFTNLFITLSGGTYATLEEAKKAGASTLNYGLFINNIVSFLIISLSIFLVVRALMSMKKKAEEAPAAPPAQEVLLTEIRDILKAKN